MTLLSLKKKQQQEQKSNLFIDLDAIKGCLGEGLSTFLVLDSGL